MENFSKKEIIDILRDNQSADWLFKLADKIRKENVGDEVHLRGLIEFSNICKRTCKYCGLRSGNKDLDRYRISPEDIISYSKKAADMGYKTIVLQSGEDSFYSAAKLAQIINKIKEFDIAVTLGVGEMSRDEYKILKDSGADRFLLRIETTDEDLYKKMHPNMDYNNRFIS